NGLNKDQVSVYKLNGRWDKLETTYESEDATHYYYNVELDSFSYFAIAQGDTFVQETADSKGRNTFLWILIALGLIAVVVWQRMRKR
ncbi:MAG: PGF-pre-PGF domain-containing protein, partial [Nanoarchaeota archaeon]|nr:PGF-pre-PGF domain-containing protein [Nanoarchaeota archaeon]